jgi:hypothetical protein
MADRNHPETMALAGVESHGLLCLFRINEMAANVTIKLGFRWKIEEGDGGKCLFCSDARFGKQARMVILVDRKEHPQNYALCQSCADAVIRHNDPVELPPKGGSESNSGAVGG